MAVSRGDIARLLLEILLATAAATVTYWYARSRPTVLAAVLARFSRHATRHATLVIFLTALAPVVLRIVVLPWIPPPDPRVHDEFGHLLVADTLAHGRLANPPHPLARHLETIHVLQSPTYASKYPIGQGLILAVGTIVTGVPWAGVLLAVGLMCGAVTWMLFGYVPAEWAAIGGGLAAVGLGTAYIWTDTFWGGAFCAFGGGVLLGSLLRLRKTVSPALGLTAGLGWAIVWLIRPYESLVLLVFTWAIVLSRAMRDEHRRRAWWATLALLGLAYLGTGGLTALHNRAVTGSVTTLPYVLNQRVYGVPQSLFGLAPIEAPHLETPEQTAVYWSQRNKKAEEEAHPLRHAWRIVEKSWRFFVSPWLCLPVLVGLVTWRDTAVRWCVILLAGALLTSSLYPSFFKHYWAAYSGVFFLLAARGLMRIQLWQPAGRPVGLAAAAFFVVGALAMVLRALPIGPVLGISDYGYVAPLRRQVADRLNAIPGSHVVFVRYGPTHSFDDEWVYNLAAIDASRIVWVRAISPDEDVRVSQYYAGRRFWLADVETGRVRVTPLRRDGGGRLTSIEGASPEEKAWVLTSRAGAVAGAGSEE